MAGPLLIAGLGNPESRYQGNRHNLGFRVLDVWAAKLKVLLLKPLTFMNRSGESVEPAARFFKVSPADLIVAHDELDLPLGRLQLKQGGGHGGHNGLRSIEAALGTREFGRLRLGIGRPPEGWDAADFVLADFLKEEAAEVEMEVQQAVAALQAVVEQGIKKAMNAHNRRA